MARERLFSPLHLGSVKLNHRIVLAPLTRFRADENHVPIDIVKDYYAQRASTPGTLLITEATFVSPRAGGLPNVPGIWNSKQIDAWKAVTDAVHAKKCFIFLQIWALGRKAIPDVLKNAEGGPYPVVSASEVKEGNIVTHALTKEEISGFVSDFATASKNAIAAGFDGVEIHGANGYLVNQFLQETSNQRTDEYGGSIENRARFGLEVTRAVIDAVGDSKKVAIRLSPWVDYDSETSPDPIPQFDYLVSELKKLDIAYLHLVESRYTGDVATGAYHTLTHRNDRLIETWGPEQPLILAGGFTPDSAREITEKRHPNSNIAIAFGRYYISTPDLPFRVQEDIPLSPYIRETFYKKMSPDGYTDYPFSPKYLESSARL